jgi:hypothetical protein
MGLAIKAISYDTPEETSSKKYRFSIFPADPPYINTSPPSGTFFAPSLQAAPLQAPMIFIFFRLMNFDTLKCRDTSVMTKARSDDQLASTLRSPSKYWSRHSPVET